MNSVIENTKASIKKQDLYALMKILDIKYKFRNVLEIGAWKGYSAKLWCDLLQPDYLCTVEKEPFTFMDYGIEKGGFPGSNAMMLYSHDSSDPQTLASVKDFFKQSYSPVDFLFIDGDHHYDAVKKDFEMYSKLMMDSGVVVFHDALETKIPGVEVNKFWNEIKGNYKNYEIKETEDSTGIGVLFL